ncbi:MAG: xanthine dehydrogenase FAD-binding subunit XdhB [Eubacteriales bacterium]|nr:xanthine dehydrogenase FAD-binding subunit XdhB [Eubacteriales bacterium]
MFDFHTVYQPETVAEALAILARDSESIVLSGGSDILIKNRDGILPPCACISIRHLRELHEITRDDDGTIFIGAASTFTEVMDSPVIQNHIPQLAEAVSQVGAVQIRNIGTVGGNLCNGAPSADSATTFLILGAKLHLESVRGTRVVSIDDFYTGPGSTVRARDELLTVIEVPRTHYEGYAGTYIKYAMRKAMDIATVGLAAMVKLTPDKDRIEDIKTAYASVAPTPVRGLQFETRLRGASIDRNLLCQAAEETVVHDISAREDWRASKAFSEHIAVEITKRGVAEAIEKAGGEHVYRCEYDG